MPYTQARIPFTGKSHTSWKAALEHGRNPARGAKLALLMLAYQAAGDGGLTDPEAADTLSHEVGSTVPVQSVCSLRGSLVDQGLVARGGERMGNYGKQVSVWFWIGRYARG